MSLPKIKQASAPPRQGFPCQGRVSGGRGTGPREGGPSVTECQRPSPQRAEARSRDFSCGAFGSAHGEKKKKVFG